VGAEFLGEARLRSARLVLYEDGYPALVDGPEGTQVSGEIYGVTHHHLRQLDEFEDVPALYQRVARRLSDGRVVQVFAISQERAQGRPEFSNCED
jgi:gamma-glutamylcyclotransferase (GGCT)/AIG2-like uncharacterized protein YtfP